MPLGPPPGAPGALLWGGSGPMSAGRSHLDPHDFRIEIYVDFDVDFGSFWGRSWVPLGGHFRSSWCFFRSKLGQKPSLNRLIFEKVIFHEILRFPMLWGFLASTWRPKTTQDRSKTGPRSSWIDAFSSSIIASILNSFRSVLVPI